MRQNVGHPTAGRPAEPPRHTPECALYRWFHPPLSWRRPVRRPPCDCGYDQRAAEYTKTGEG